MVGGNTSTGGGSNLLGGGGGRPNICQNEHTAAQNVTIDRMQVKGTKIQKAMSSVSIFMGMIEQTKILLNRENSMNEHN